MSTTADFTLGPLLTSSVSASTEDETTVSRSTEPTTTTPTTSQPHGMEFPIWLPIVGGIVLIILIILVALWFKRCRHRGRYDYTALRDQISLPEKMAFAKRQQYDSMRESALMNCSFYLRSNGLYMLLDHLPEMGSRVKKHWFLVRDNKTKSEKLLTMMNKSPQMILPFNTQTKQTVSELCLLLQHPYIYPIHDLDFVIEQDMIVVVQPLSSKGSLKDAIYNSRCTDKWGEKYSFRSTGLPIPKIQLFGRQILEALLFLEEKGFPPFQHLSSGNVILNSHICRLAGFENVLFSQPSKLQPLLKKMIKKNNDVVDTICFGHLLFEMSTGFELDSPHPEPKHLISVPDSVLQILNFIFENPTGSYPSIRQISEHGFFRDVVIREATMFNPQPIHMTPAMKTVLKSLRKGKLVRSKSKRDSLIAVEDETKMTSRQRSGSKSSVGKSKRSKSTKENTKRLSVQDKNGKQSQEDTALVDVTTVPVVTSGRNSLLQEITKGKLLKKTQTNDRSVPKV